MIIGLFEKKECLKHFYKAVFTVAVAVLSAVYFLCVAYADEAYLLGDADFNGKINSADARLVLRFAVSLDEYNEKQALISDVNKNGEIKADDARLVLRQAVGFGELDGETVTIQSADESGTPDNNDEFFESPDADGQFEEIPDIFEKVVPEVPQIEPQEDTFTFVVYGYGHGVGLSQYGAVALAENGFNYTDILAYYYTGTSVIFGEEYPETSYYPVNGELTEINTEELVARIVAQEIGGITKNENALKTQAVAIFTLLKRYEFSIQNKWDVGYAVSSYDKCSDTLKKAVSEVIGQYVALTDDEEKKPILAVYSAMSAGMSASAKDVWGSNISYLSSVESPFEMRLSDFISLVSFTSEEMKELILAYDDSIVLSEDPNEWISILSHSESVDENTGYVQSIQVGDKTLKGYSQFKSGIMQGKLKSSCFTVVYTPKNQQEETTIPEENATVQNGEENG